MDARYLAQQVPFLRRHGCSTPECSSIQASAGYVHLTPHVLPEVTDILSQEWAIVFIAAFLFFAGCEGYKLAKRVYFRRKAKKTDGPKMLSAEDRVFSRYLSTDSRWDSEGEKNEKMRNPV
jgi:hypothetical protein